MSTFVNFVPGVTTPFLFQPTLNGVQYTVTVPWNIKSERYYINVTDLAGNPILYRSLSESGPVNPVSLTWAGGVATAVSTVAHNVSVGQLANIRIAQTDTSFDGLYQALAVDPQTFTFSLPVNPNEATAIAGQIDQPLDLLAGYGIGALYFHADTQTFEF